ncbi:MAG: heat-inducible transcriptional repressor HrcA [Gemmatimonadaceae bacterium]
MSLAQLSDRERRVLAAVIRSYVETAEPAGSRMISRRYMLDLSAATIRNTMSDLEDKGFLFHPHTSAGRVPTDMAYRTYVDSLMHFAPLEVETRDALLEQLSGGGTAIEAVLRRAAQVLGVLTQELGIALGPRLDEARLERLELIKVSAERLLLVLRLTGGAARSIFVEVPGEIAEKAIAEVTEVLNERLAGCTWRELRTTLSERLRDQRAGSDAGELINIFVQEAEQMLDARSAFTDPQVVLGQASVLAEQPEFATSDNLRKLLALTERPDALGALLQRQNSAPGISITIGAEHGDPRLSGLTVVTAEYHAGALAGVIGVIGPTRMPYEKVVSLVTHTSRLISDLLD